MHDADPLPPHPSGEGRRAAPQADDAAGRKAALRERLLTARATHDSAWRAEASAAIVEAVRQLPEVRAARAGLGYAAFGTEVAVDSLLRGWLAEGVAVHLPFVDGDDLGIAPIADLDADTAPGWGGVREPRPADRAPADPSVIDVAVIPGVGFDPDGRRLGYGGGHFDRLLARLRHDALVVGVAFSSQVVTRLPADHHDVPVHVLVTEDATRRPGPARGH